MRLETPVIALAQTGVKDTMNGAGLMFDEYNPAMIAEAIRLIKEDGALRSKIIERQRERVRVFDKDRLTGIFRKALESAIVGVA
jgi:glycosyltransferase involved in cell wall biosynthesis